MNTEEHKRLIARMNEAQPSDRAAILAIMDCGGDIRISTFGNNTDIGCLRAQLLRSEYGKEGGDR